MLNFFYYSSCCFIRLFHPLVSSICSYFFHNHPSTLLSFFLCINIRQFFFCRNFFLIFFYEKMSRRSAKTSTKRPVEKESEGSGFDLNKKQRKVYKDATETIESAYIFF